MCVFMNAFALLPDATEAKAKESVGLIQIHVLVRINLTLFCIHTVSKGVVFHAHS